MRVPVLGDVVGEVGGGVLPPLLLERCTVAGRAPVEAERVELGDPLRGQGRGLVSSVGAAPAHPCSEPESVLALPAVRHVEVPVLVPVPSKSLESGRPLLGEVVDGSAGPWWCPIEPEGVELRDPLRGQAGGVEAAVFAAVHHPRRQPHPVLAHVPLRDAGVAVFGDERLEVRDAVLPQLRWCLAGPPVRVGPFLFRIGGGRDLGCYSQATPSLSRSSLLL